MRRSHDGYRMLGGIPSLDTGRGLRVDQMVMRRLRAKRRYPSAKGGFGGGDSPPDGRGSGGNAPSGRVRGPQARRYDLCAILHLPTGTFSEGLAGLPGRLSISPTAYYEADYQLTHYIIVGTPCPVSSDHQFFTLIVLRPVSV